ncbi:hypothetical protein FCU45_06980 [Sulfurimonas crateris]|uniref:Cytochrome C n=1 Tax=Sulfurimonas crateris TaxID=2574727 RepID=A0A4U2Z504_9BACT|nr:hypothetical protein [Sulfurimonas crateris]TKI69258.1 hypothetical protein FCU45_06980 [Sulfurimonas crateris]
MMKARITAKRIISMVGLSLMCATAAEATPAFARQMDADCMSCHFQNMPKLNAFGRDFKMSGFTMTSGKEMKSEPNGGLGLPETLNMAFVIKARVLDSENKYAKTEIFDESAFIFGGKIADNVGTSMEFAEGLIGGKVTFATEALGGRVGATYHMTDALGAFAGTEIYTTGLYRPVRQFENRKKTNIFQNLGIGDGEATGAQVYYRANGFYATVGGYVPMFAASAETGTDSFKALARAAYEFNIGSSTIALGGYYIGGNSGQELTDRLLDGTGEPLSDLVHGLDTDALDRESAGIDLQVESAIADMSLMLTGGYVFKNDYSSYYDPNGNFLTSTTAIKRERTGYHLDLQINPVERFGAKIAILGYNDELIANNDYTVYSLGLEYNMRQNVRFCVEYSNTSHDSPTNTLEGDEFLFMSMISF